MGKKAEKFAARFQPVALRYNFPEKDDGAPETERAREMPRGGRRFWGIPFRLATEDERSNVLRLRKGETAEIHLGGQKADGRHYIRTAENGKATINLGGHRADYLCFLHYWEGSPELEEGDAGGEIVAEYRLAYADGAVETFPIRSRYEIGWSGARWGQHLYAAVGHSQPETFDFMDPESRRKREWGRLQTDAAGYGLREPWIYAMPNPRPEESIMAVELGAAESPVGVLGLTLYEGPGHPLRHNPRRYFRLELPKGTEPKSMDVDLGVLVRDAGGAVPRDERWLKAVEAGLGVPEGEGEGEGEKENVRLFEASAADGATLTVKSGEGEEKKTYRLSLGEAYHEDSSRDGEARLDVVHPGRSWVHVTIRDVETGKEIPARVHFSGPDGEYYAPYGHHTVVNDNWFEDYGADIKLGGMSYAYVPGRFQTNLPVGELYVEAAKGFEYEPVRKKLTIKPGQRELELTLRRWTDRAKEGWVTADTHVHFISPHTAHLQGRCEGLNLVNLLASQWGRLFTNVGDITGEVGVEKEETLVWVGTENRNHILGHISMLGTRGEPVFPMCSGGPGEAYVGDPDERSMAEWADECRKKQGVVIRPHFPGPNLENPVDIVLGKFDGLEIRSYYAPGSGPLDTFTLREYYRYLNCGYRVGCVGGTDKMSAGMPVGGVRTYARLDENRPFTFENWAEAVRAGRTYSSSGPLIDISVEGRGMGEEVNLTGGRGTVELCASAECAWPIHRLEVVRNGEVVAETYRKNGAKKLEVKAKVKVEGSSWFAARCASELQVMHCWPIFISAHTSPVYVVVPGKELFSPSDATYMLTLIDGGLTHLETLSVRYDEHRHRQMKAVYEKARDALHARLHGGGQAHGHNA